MISPLLDRFDLIWLLSERTDREEIDYLAGHTPDGRDVATHHERGDDIPEDMRTDVDGEVNHEVLRASLQE